MVKVAPVKEKSISQIGLTWGNGKIWLLDNVSLDVNTMAGFKDILQKAAHHSKTKFKL